MNKQTTRRKASIHITTTSVSRMPESIISEILLSSFFSDTSIDMAEGLDRDDDDELNEEYIDGGPIIESPNHGNASIPDDFGDGNVYVSVLGEMEYGDREFRINYRETELPDMNTAYTVFALDDPDEITMVRNGATRTALCFNKKLERRICCFNDSFFPIEVAVITEKFKNTIDPERGGVLDVTYRVELRGIPMEKNRLVLKVRPL